jgi:hypothetical protein
MIRVWCRGPIASHRDSQWIRPALVASRSTASIRPLPCRSSRAAEVLTCDPTYQGESDVIEPGVTVSAPGSWRDLACAWQERLPARHALRNVRCRSEPSRTRWSQEVGQAVETHSRAAAAYQRPCQPKRITAV